MSIILLNTAIYQHLIGDTAVAAIVSTRVYPSIAPPTATVPYIVFEKISGFHLRNTTAPAGLAQPRIEINCYDDDTLGAELLADKVRIALDHFSGLMGTDPAPAPETRLTVRDVHLGGDRMEFFQPSKGGQIGIHSVRMDFMVWHVEAAA